MLQTISRFVEQYFLVIALLMSGTALFNPAIFTWIQPHIPIGLGIIMFGMGMALDFQDFADVFPKWRLVGLGVLLQFTVMPLIALAVNQIFNLPLEIAIGVGIVGACPGGTASNVMTYLARGNVALSVVMTLVSTTLGPLLTPAIIYLLFKTKVDIAFLPMAESVFWIVVFPLIDGLILRRLLRTQIKPLLDIFPSISIITISMVVACVVGLSQKTLLAFPLAIITAVIVHNLSGLSLGYWLARLAGSSKRDARTVAIEVGMQNSGLGVALANKFFSAAAALPGAIFSLEQNLAGIIMIKIWELRAGNLQSK